MNFGFIVGFTLKSIVSKLFKISTLPKPQNDFLDKVKVRLQILRFPVGKKP